MEQFFISFKTGKYAPVRTATAITNDSDEAVSILKDRLIEEGHKKRDIYIVLIEPQGVVAGHHVSICENMEV